MPIVLDPQGSNLVIQDTKGNSYTLTRLSYRAALSEVPVLEADLVCKGVDASSWLGETLVCEFYRYPGASRSSERRFEGVVTGIKNLASSDAERYSCYRLRIQPWLALLAYSRNHRVFQDKTTQQIITSLFDELGFKGQYRVDSMPTTKRPYCLQFNETDLDFVQRLLAEEGVHYHFGQNEDANTLILHEASKPFSKSDKIALDSVAVLDGINAVVSRWQPRYQYHGAELELACYDDQQTKLVSSKSKKSGYTLPGNTKLKEFRYPAASVSGQMDDLAAALVSCRRAQLDSNYQLIDGEADSAELGVGRYLELATHLDKEQQGEYLLVAVEQEFVVDSQSGFSQSCNFTCTPSDHDYYPAFVEKPRTYGMQSAVVAGKIDAEPASDKQGRIRILFQWDTETEGDETSCWVRVAQSMAGNGYGVQFIPRAGQEVLVSFLDGDPDRPLVTGSLYNSKHKPPYATQDSTQSGIKTQLKAKANELRFDDKKDNEQLYLHAAKDLLIEVENDADEKVTAEKRVAVTKDITVSSDQNYSLTTKENINLKTDKNYALAAVEVITVDGKTIILEASDKLELIVGGSKLIMTDSKIEIESETISLSGSSAIELDADEISVSGDSSVDLTSGDSMSLEASSDFAASGMNAELKATSAVTVKGSGSAELSASGNTTVKGAMVMIN